MQLCNCAEQLGRCLTYIVTLSESGDLQHMHPMSCCTMQAAQDNLHPALSTLHVSTYDVYGISVVTHKAAQSCKLNVAVSTQEALTVVC